MAAILALAGAALLALSPAALADTYRPNKLGDHPPNRCSRKDCTLREAVIKANHHTGPDRIVLQGGKTYNLAIGGANEEEAKTGDLDVAGSLTIKRHGKGRATVNAHHVDRVFDLPSGAGPSTFSGLMITRGSSVQGSGAEVNEGSLRLVNDVIRGNVADFGGGLMPNGAPIKVIRSTVAGNHANTSGGGFYNIGNSLISRSTISGNSTDGEGGGIVSAGGTLTVRDSTIAANRSAASGGGIWAAFFSTTNLNSVTIARNEADSAGNGGAQGGGIFSNGGPNFTVANTLIALNTFGPGTGDADPQCSGMFVSGGHNLRSSSDPDCVGFSGTGDLVKTHPKIGKLADNGGPTKTIALLKGSPAINHGGPDAEKRDQRGVLRGAKPDIGAYERR